MIEIEFDLNLTNVLKTNHLADSIHLLSLLDCYINHSIFESNLLRLTDYLNIIDYHPINILTIFWYENI